MWKQITVKLLVFENKKYRLKQPYWHVMKQKISKKKNPQQQKVNLISNQI
jgi:hypothetical protein